MIVTIIELFNTDFFPTPYPIRILPWIFLTNSYFHFQARKKGTSAWTESIKGRDKYSWLLCANRQTHVPEQLLLTQIIPANCLAQIDQKLHECRSEWGVPKYCSCSAENKPVNENLSSLIKGDLVSVMNGDVKQEKHRACKKEHTSTESSRENGEDKNSPLIWLADVALQNQDDGKNDSNSDSDSDEEDGHSTLRELLIRPSQKSNGSGPNSPDGESQESANPQQGKAGKKSNMDTLNEVISSVIEHSVPVCQLFIFIFF